MRVPEERVETDVQFWRDSEQCWVDHVLIKSYELDGKPAAPTRWRYRVRTIVTTVGPWEAGRP